MIVPGFAFASASSSCGVAAPTDGCTVRISGDDASSATPVKSLRGVVGELLVHERRDHERRGREHQRVAVGGRPRDLGGARRSSPRRACSRRPRAAPGARRASARPAAPARRMRLPARTARRAGSASSDTPARRRRRPPARRLPAAKMRSVRERSDLIGVLRGWPHRAACATARPRRPGCKWSVFHTSWPRLRARARRCQSRRLDPTAARGGTLAPYVDQADRRTAALPAHRRGDPAAHRHRRVRARAATARRARAGAQARRFAYLVARSAERARARRARGHPRRLRRLRAHRAAQPDAPGSARMRRKRSRRSTCCAHAA